MEEADNVGSSLFEKADDAEEPKKDLPYWCSCRFALAYLCFFGSLFVNSMRLNLSLTIVCMVTNDSSVDNSTSEDVGRVFSWSRERQGLLLSSCFYGFMLSSVPAGVLADRYGSKWIIASGMALSGVCTFSIALVDDYWSIFALRFITGLSSGVFLPSTMSMLSRWAPPLERSRLIAIAVGGMVVGAALTNSGVGILCDTIGWPSVFYITGAGPLLWCLVWSLTTSSVPEDNKFIGRTELDYIRLNLILSKKVQIPWRKLLGSLPVYAVIIVHGAKSWHDFTLFLGLNLYINDMLRMDLTSNGLVSSLPYVLQFVSAIAAAHVADYCRTRGVRTVVVRRTAQALGTVVQVVCMIAIGFLDSERAFGAIGLVYLTLVAGGMNSAGYKANIIEIAPRFAGLIMGILNAFGLFLAMLCPLIIGSLTGAGDRQGWQIVFLLTAGVVLAGNVFFVVFARGEERKWCRSDIILDDRDETTTA